jgi:hypothetical protein
MDDENRYFRHGWACPGHLRGAVSGAFRRPHCVDGRDKPRHDGVVGPLVGDEICRS